MEYTRRKIRNQVFAKSSNSSEEENGCYNAFEQDFNALLFIRDLIDTLFEALNHLVEHSLNNG